MYRIMHKQANRDSEFVLEMSVSVPASWWWKHGTAHAASGGNMGLLTQEMQ